MTENGWDFSKIINPDRRLVLPRYECNYNLLDTIAKHNWIMRGWLPSMISATFWAKGRVQLLFGNCNVDGEVTILVDGTEIEKSKPDGKQTNATFNVDEGSKLIIKADNRAIIKLFDIDIECGNELR